MGVFLSVRCSRTSYRFRSLHSSSFSKRSFPKGSKKTALSFTHSAALRSAPFVHSFADFLHILESSQGGICASGARSNASTVSPVASCICFAVALRFVVCLFPQVASFHKGTFFVIRKHRILNYSSSWRL